METASGYIQLLHTGELERRAAAARQNLRICNVCPWYCPVDRLAEQLGVCRTGQFARVASYGPHMGEEDPLRGFRGSGTIFFSRCNLHCQYCQNYNISQSDAGQEITAQDLGQMMLELQAQGCHNINFVSPSHVVPQILEAVLVAAQKGLNIPLVYNTGGYDSPESLLLLDGVVDIYMPDMKYADPMIARRFSTIRNYPQINQTAVKEMHRQVGDLLLDERGIAVRGLLIRHLVLPNGLAGSEEIVKFIAEDISTNTYLNLMDQYRPAYGAHKHPDLNRRITREEFQHAVRLAIQAGLHRLDQRKPWFSWAE